MLGNWKNTGESRNPTCSSLFYKLFSLGPLGETDKQKYWRGSRGALNEQKETEETSLQGLLEEVFGTEKFVLDLDSHWTMEFLWSPAGRDRSEGLKVSSPATKWQMFQLIPTSTRWRLAGAFCYWSGLTAVVGWKLRARTNNLTLLSAVPTGNRTLQVFHNTKKKKNTSMIHGIFRERYVL